MLTCPHCGKGLEHPNTVSSRKIRQARKDQGLCPQCGKPLEGEDKQYHRCADCREKENTRQAIRRHR